MLSRTTIIPVDAYDDTIRLIFLGNYFGHTDIVVKSTKTGTVEARVENAMELATQDSIVPYPVIDIPHLTEGEYEVYTLDPSHTECSLASYVTLTGESSKEQLATCSELSKANADSILDCIKLPDGLDSILTLHERYLAAEDDTDKIALAKLLMQSVSLVNRRMNQGQMMSEDTYLADSESLLLDDTCNYVLRRDVTTNSVSGCAPLDASGIAQMPEDDDHIYFYTEVDGEGVPYGFLLTFRPNSIVYGILKEDSINSSETFQNAVEKVSTMSLEDIAFEAGDESFLAILNELQPAGPYFHAPELSIENGIISAAFEEDEKKILALFPESYRLAVNPVDIALDVSQRITVDIPGRDFAVYTYKLNLSSEDYVYWVEDVYGNIVSDIRALCMRNDFLAQIEIDAERTRALNGRTRQLFLEKYRKHLMPFVKANYEDVSSLVQDAYTYCESSDAYAQDAGFVVIENCLSRGNMSLLPDIFMGIMKDKTMYGSYATNFFSQPPVYHANSHRLSMPPESNVLYQVDRCSYDEGCRTDFFRANPHEAVDFHLTECDFAVFSAIDVRTGRRSGFLFFDFDYQNSGRVKMIRFLIDAKEVCD